MPSTVYWAPYIEDDLNDWNLLYEDLESLHSITYTGLASPLDKHSNFFYCPAFTNVSKSTFVVKNPMETFISLEDSKIVLRSKNGILTEKIHDSTLKNNPLLVYGLRYIFFSEDDIDLTLTSPYFSNSPHLQHASLVPGRINIANWFRVIHLEYNLWNTSLNLKKDEHIAYFNFSKEVTLKRFRMNNELYKIANATSSSSKWEKFVPLVDRYKRFKKSRTDKIVLEHIKNNLV